MNIHKVNQKGIWSRQYELFKKYGKKSLLKYSTKDNS